MMNLQQNQQQMQQMFQLLTDQLKIQKEKSDDDRNVQKGLIDALKKDTHDKTEKKVKCPRWAKEEPFKSFKSNLKIWDSCYHSKGKYLELLDSLQESGRIKEKQRVELEVQNGLLDPSEEEVIKKLVDKLDSWFGKTKMDESCESWKKFISIVREKDEKVDKFLLRYETVESDLKCSQVGVSQIALAIQ